MSHQISKGCLAIALAFSFQAYAQAQQTSVSQQTTSVTGPATVVDSYMKPTVVRSKESTDSDGNVEKTVEPLVMERHERVVVPELQTTTTEVKTAGTETVKSESKQVATHAVSHSCAPKRVSYHPRHHRTYTAHRASSATIAQKVIKVERPATTERTESVTEKDTVIERRDPALDNN